jgi:tetratricopeptide (TPR) repeat protein
VEYAFRLGERQNLINSYLELADAFFRSGASDRAVTVYQRVLEHDAGNQRAVSALQMLEPPPTEAPAPKAAPPAAAAKSGGGDFVDLGSFLDDDEELTVKGDARMRIQDEEPTGDEERDFADMLSQFKKGIEQTVDAGDAQTHYDLGVAFKEMGLLDEAIAEFQKALQGKDMKNQASEALGVTFFEKGQPQVAATVMKRAIEGDTAGDDQKIGLLYWLGRCEEEQGRLAEALACYQRVFAVNIRFQDVNDRVKSLAKAAK